MDNKVLQLLNLGISRFLQNLTIKTLIYEHTITGKSKNNSCYKYKKQKMRQEWSRSRLWVGYLFDYVV